MHLLRRSIFFDWPQSIRLLGILLLLTSSDLLRAAEPPATDCFSCRIVVDSLEEALPLQGRWLFSRIDSPVQAHPETDTSSWVQVQTPGPWQKAYGDGQNFRVGWYRGHFQFAPHLVGKEVTLYVDAYMSRMRIYKDGQLIYGREGRNHYEKFNALRPIPIVFTITQTHHVIAMRVDTPLMVGIYQLPFQLRPYKPFDPLLGLIQFIFGDLRLIAAFMISGAGVYFMLLYWQLRDRLYFISGLTCFSAFPFYAFPTDTFANIAAPDVLLMLHYIGLVCLTLGSYCFSLMFRSVPRWITWSFCAAAAASILAYGYLAFHLTLGTFQLVRPATFLISSFMNYMALYNLARPDRNRQFLTWPIYLSIAFFFFVAMHDAMLAIGLIQSMSLLFLGTLGCVYAMIYTTSNIFKHSIERIINEEKLRKHAYGEMSKILYPHQIQLIESGSRLEETMPVGPSRACVLCFDIVGSSKIDHPEARTFIRNLFNSCNSKMLESYLPSPLTSNAYRIKELGDGFLCSVGYPFASPTGSPAADAVKLAFEIFEAFRCEARILGPEFPLSCGIGIASGQVESFYPEAGTREYDLFGRGIILATRYETMARLLIDRFGPASYLIVHQDVYQALPSPLQSRFTHFDLGDSQVKVRDDHGARSLYFVDLSALQKEDQAYEPVA